MSYNRDVNKANQYKDIIGKCCNPKCDSVTFALLETHHIRPLKHNGPDSYVNYIILCKDCHRKIVHKNKRFSEETLLMWKFYNELLIIGETSDDYDDKYYKLIMKAHKKANK